MKKLFAVFALFLLLPAWLWAVDISPLNFELGDIAAPALVEKEILIKNNGTAPLVLKKVRVSCDCLSVSLKERTSVQPEEVFSLTFKLDPARLSKGKFRKYLFIEIENAEKPLYAVEIHGNVL